MQSISGNSMRAFAGRCQSQRLASVPNMSFGTSSIRLMGKGGHVADGDDKAHVWEREKQKQGEHEGDVKHAPGWSSKLASQAEADVKAEREETRTPEELQRDQKKGDL